MPVNSIPRLITLPAVDAANMASAVTNLSSGVVAICPGPVPGQVFNIVGFITVAPGQTVLTEAFGAATGATFQSMGGATVIFSGGKSADVLLFPF